MSLSEMTAKPNPARFARIPESVLLDPKLTPTDIYVYAALAAHCFVNNIFTLGQRYISKYLNLHRRTVRRSIENLGAAGHISTAIKRISRRTIYQLNSPVFLSNFENVWAQKVPLSDDRMGSELRPRYRTKKEPKPN